MLRLFPITVAGYQDLMTNRRLTRKHSTTATVMRSRRHIRPSGQGKTKMTMRGVTCQPKTTRRH